ncbi:MAG: YajQ family cyclic di-GMP-binding protein [Coriobacteriia bacterium]|nr:YajQ family cyclic di-GMP-binding protein [Coriobacteriia bacterium]
MAKDSSFDVVSEVDLQEVDNAYQQAAKELIQRYDLKDSGAALEYSKGEKTFTLTAPSDFVAKQVMDVLNGKLVRRNVDLKAVSWGTPQAASGDGVRYLGKIVMGIETDLARKINKDIRDQKFKVKVQIEGDKLRVFSSSRDDLQAVIGFLKDADYGIPLQYTNYR